MSAPSRTASARIVLNTTAGVFRDLEILAATGLFGVSIEAVAEELLRHRLREVVREGWLPMEGRVQ